MSSVTDAFRRAAARGGPLYTSYNAYRRCLDDKGRPATGLYDYMFAAPGAVRWKDLEDNKGEQGDKGQGGNGVATMYTDYVGAVPDLIQDQNGNWLAVISGLERDSLGAGLRLHVQRWCGALPTIRNGAP